MDILQNTRKFLKDRLQSDKASFYEHANERNHIKDLLERTAKEGESNSALLIAPKSYGKTSLVYSVLCELLQDNVFASQALIVSLDGYVHTDDRQALKSTTKQMNLSKEAEGKIFNSFSENLTFLFSCLKEGKDARRLIFIIEAFDLFCGHHNQTLLYNLFDVAQSAQTPICVLGITNRVDVVELLEKRVKSRFSHRQILLLPDSENFDAYLATFAALLTLPEPTKRIDRSTSLIIESSHNLPFLRMQFDTNSYNFSQDHVESWNTSILKLTENEKVIESLRHLFENKMTIASLKSLLFELVCKLDSHHTQIEANDVTKFIDKLLNNDKVKLIVGLSVLEICLLIAIKHHSDIYDNEPFNFEIIFARFSKFAITSRSMQSIEREMALLRFENLKFKEIIAPLTSDGKLQKEYQMHRITVFPDCIDRAIQSYRNLPTEIKQWAKSSII